MNLSCTGCRQFYSNNNPPRKLPCNHVLCSSCLTFILEASAKISQKNKPEICCTECKQWFHLYSANAAQFDIDERISCQLNKTVTKCLHKVRWELYCQKCGHYFCRDCSDEHKYCSQTNSHYQNISRPAKREGDAKHCSYDKAMKILQISRKDVFKAQKIRSNQLLNMKSKMDYAIHSLNSLSSNLIKTIENCHHHKINLITQVNNARSEVINGNIKELEKERRSIEFQIIRLQNFQAPNNQFVPYQMPVNIHELLSNPVAEEPDVDINFRFESLVGEFRKLREAFMNIFPEQVPLNNNDNSYHTDNISNGSNANLYSSNLYSASVCGQLDQIQNQQRKLDLIDRSFYENRPTTAAGSSKYDHSYDTSSDILRPYSQRSEYSSRRPNNPTRVRGLQSPSDFYLPNIHHK